MVEQYIADVAEEDHFLVLRVELSGSDVRLTQHIDGSIVLFAPTIAAILQFILPIDLIFFHR